MTEREMQLRSGADERPKDPAPRPMISGRRWRSLTNPPRLVGFGWAPITPAASQR